MNTTASGWYSYSPENFTTPFWYGDTAIAEVRLGRGVAGLGLLGARHPCSCACGLVAPATGRHVCGRFHLCSLARSGHARPHCSL